MPDIFNYDKSAQLKGAVAHTDAAIIKIANSSPALTQSITCSYGQNVQEVTQVGDASVYWIPGRPSGSIDISKLVGGDGFFSGWVGHECGVIDSVNVDVGEAVCSFQGKGSLSFSGGVIESVTLTINNGSLAMAEQAKIKVTSLTAS